MIEEIFVPIKDFSDCYTISNYGNVYSLVTNKQLKPYIVAGRYYGITLCRDGHKYYRRINRLVAEHFLPDPNEGATNKFVMSTEDMVVNHKDLNKLNNYFENLEWMRQIENVHHYYRNRNKKSRIERKFNEYDQMEYEREQEQEQEQAIHLSSI
jgi:hypothetical protein